MATVTGLTAEKMQELSDENIVGGNVVGSDLILTRRDAGTVNAGAVVGPAGAQGPQGPAGAGTVTICTNATRPGSPTTGQQIYETDKLRFYMWDGSAWLWVSGNPPAAKLRAVGFSQLIPNNTFTAIAFPSATELYDTDGMHDYVTFNSRITIPTGWSGLWQFGGGSMWFLNATGNRAVGVFRNSTLTDRLAYGDQPHTDYGGIGGSITVAGEAKLSAGDWLELYVFQSSGGDLEVHGTANYPPILWASYKGRA